MAEGIEGLGGICFLIFFCIESLLVSVGVYETPEQSVARINRTNQAKQVETVTVLSQRIEPETLFLTQDGKLYLYSGKTEDGQISLRGVSDYQKFPVLKFAKILNHLYPPNIGGLEGRDRGKLLKLFRIGVDVVDIKTLDRIS